MAYKKIVIIYMTILNEVINLMFEDIQDLDPNLQVLWDILSGKGFTSLNFINKNTIIFKFEESGLKFTIFIVAGSKIYADFTLENKNIKKSGMPELEFALSEDPRVIVDSILATISNNIPVYDGDFNNFWRRLPQADSGHRAYIKLGDGTKLSVQAGSANYSRPRGKSNNYSHFEVGFPSREISELMPYIEIKGDDPTNSVYPYVPVDVLDEIMSKYGVYGIAN
jgi:hypothetical protein